MEKSQREIVHAQRFLLYITHFIEFCLLHQTICQQFSKYCQQKNLMKNISIKTIHLKYNLFLFILSNSIFPLMYIVLSKYTYCMLFSYLPLGLSQTRQIFGQNRQTRQKFGQKTHFWWFWRNSTDTFWRVDKFVHNFIKINKFTKLTKNLFLEWLIIFQFKRICVIHHKL